MATPDFKHFNDIEFIQQTNPVYLQRLLAGEADFLARHGIPLDSIDGSEEANRKLVRLFTDPKVEMPGRLAEALCAVDELAEEAGHDRFIEMAEAQGVVLPTDEDLAPGDLAIKFFLDFYRLFQRVHHAFSFAAVKRFDEFQAVEDVRVAAPDPAKVRDLEGRLGKVFAARLRGAVCEIDVLDQGRELTFLVSHGRPYRSEGTYDKRLRRSRVAFRPRKCDSVIYDKTTGILKVNATMEAERQLYRREFGALLFGDPEHFPATTKRYTLAPLIERGRDALRGIDGVVSATLTEVWIDHGNAERYMSQHRALDLLATIERCGLSVLTTGTLVRACLRVKYASGGQARRLELRPPNVAIYDRRRDAKVTEDLLAVNGFIIPSARGVRRAQAG